MYTPEVEQFIKDLGFEKIETDKTTIQSYRHSIISALTIKDSLICINPRYTNYNTIGFRFDPLDKASLLSKYTL